MNENVTYEFQNSFSNVLLPRKLIRNSQGTFYRSCLKRDMIQNVSLNMFNRNQFYYGTFFYPSCCKNRKPYYNT